MGSEAMPDERVCETYHPEVDLAERWPDWWLFDTPDLPRGERFSPTLKTILFNSGGDREWAVAHLLAHLDLGHHLAMREGTFTSAQEADADLLRRIRMDLLRFEDDSRPDDAGWDEIPLDGPPTVRLDSR
jgi:hypothetical protein